MGNWADQIGGCFSIEDYTFATHPLDKERARKMLCDALDQGVGFDEYCNTISDWLYNKLGSCNTDLINKKIESEMSKVKDLSTYFSKD